jgi:hypothetical protein
MALTKGAFRRGLCGRDNALRASRQTGIRRLANECLLELFYFSGVFIQKVAAGPQEQPCSCPGRKAAPLILGSQEWSPEYGSKSSSGIWALSPAVAV